MRPHMGLRAIETRTHDVTPGIPDAFDSMPTRACHQGLTRPVLHFRGETEGTVRFSLAMTGDARVTLEGRAVEGRAIGAIGPLAFRAFDFTAERGDGPRDIAFGVNGEAFRFRLGARRETLRLAYASCNGGEDEELARAHPEGRNGMWADLLAVHEANPFHILIMGGDQIYADAVWHEPAFEAWRALPRATRLTAPFTEAMCEEAEDFFARRYLQVWNEREVSTAFSSIPVLMMWDDHDISDGWGSYPDEERLAPVAQGLFGVARRAFALFQLGTDPDAPDVAGGFMSETGRHFGWTGTCGPVTFIAPDLRSERTLTRVMEEGHDALDRALNAATGHVLFVSSVPLVNVDLSWVERLMRRTPYDKYVDDLRDQWMSYAHQAEWARVANRLLDVPLPVTVLSGEIHLAAHGTIERGGAVVEQLTASGIAHPPPPDAFARALEWMVRRPWQRGDITLTMHEQGATGRRYLAVRNWMEVEVDADGLSGILHAEGYGAIEIVSRVSEAYLPAEAMRFA